MEVLDDALKLIVGEVASLEQRCREQIAYARLVFDDLVHERLGHRRVVPLVVTAAAVAHHVDHDVAVEALTVRECDFSSPHDGLGVVAVDVENRQLRALRDIGRIERAAR